MVIVTRMLDKTDDLELKPINDRLIKTRINSKFAKLTLVACVNRRSGRYSDHRFILPWLLHIKDDKHHQHRAIPVQSHTHVP